MYDVLLTVCNHLLTYGNSSSRRKPPEHPVQRPPAAPPAGTEAVDVSSSASGQNRRDDSQPSADELEGRRQDAARQPLLVLGDALGRRDRQRPVGQGERSPSSRKAGSIAAKVEPGGRNAA